MTKSKFKTTKEWKEVRLKALERDKGCIVCGRTKEQGWKIDVHHLIPDGYNIFKEWRADITNLVCLCAKHHEMGKWSAHKNPFWFVNWMKTHREGTYHLTMDRLEDVENGLQEKEEL